MENFLHSDYLLRVCFHCTIDWNTRETCWNVWLRCIAHVCFPFPIVRFGDAILRLSSTQYFLSFLLSIPSVTLPVNCKLIVECEIFNKIRCIECLIPMYDAFIFNADMEESSLLFFNTSTVYQIKCSDDVEAIDHRSLVEKCSAFFLKFPLNCRCSIAIWPSLPYLSNCF